MESIMRGPRAVNVGRTERLLSVAGGLGLLAYATTRHPRLALPLLVGSGYLVYRGASGHCFLYQLVGIGRGRQGDWEGVKVERALTINKPPDQVFSYWRNLENLPRLMNHLQAVQVIDDKHSHWVARAPLGARIEWDAEIYEERENELLAWRSLPGAEVENRGYVWFKPAPAGRGTQVHISLTYQPPGGSAGAALARFLGQAPSQQIQQDLHHLKQFLETGELATVQGQPSGAPPLLRRQGRGKG